MPLSAFNTIGLMGRNRDQATIDTFSTLIPHLIQQHKHILIDETIPIELATATANLASQEKIAKSADLIIVVGGDGSFLQAAKIALRGSKPIIGINRGRLGFLTDIKPDELASKLDAMLNGAYHQEERFLLDAFLESHENKSCTALNDIVLATGDAGHMIEFEIYVNDCFMSNERSDGMIIATPTGSTAYALSGGGPIIHPALNAIVLVPMFSHTLSSRPIVVSGDSTITLVLGQKKMALPPRISADGEKFFDLAPEQLITIKKTPETLHLLHPLDYDYFENVRSKLYWGKKK